MAEIPTPPAPESEPKPEAPKVSTSPVTLKIQQLLGEGRIETEADLDFIVEHHSALLSGDRIIPIVANIPPAFAELPQTRFLQAVVFYHLQHKEKVEQKWVEAHQQFSQLPEGEIGTHLGFYIPNYKFLSLRNANGDPEELERIFTQTKEAAEKMPEPERQQLLGFILYNYARLLIKLQREERQAADMYIKAGAARVAYYEAIRDTADDREKAAAAKEVWKIRQDWYSAKNPKGFLPNTDISECPISETLFEEVELLADKNFSATK